MKNNRLSGLIAFVVAILMIGGLTYYEWTQSQQKETVIVGQAESDDMGPPGDKPIMPPASLTEDKAAAPVGDTPAPTAPAAETPAPSDKATADATANPPAAAGDQPADTAPVVGMAAPGADNQPAMEAPAAATPAAETPAAAAPTDQANAAPPAAEPPPPANQQQVATAEPPPTAGTANAPAMAAPTAVVPTFDVVRVEPTGETVVAGQAVPEAKVEILDGAAAIATATANDRGEWAMALDNALKPGTHDLAIRTTTKDGAVSTLSDQRVAVQVPEPGSKDVLVVLNSPDQPSRVLELPKAGEPAAGEQQVAAAEKPATAGEPAAAPATPETPKAGGDMAGLEQPQPGAGEPAPAAVTAAPSAAAGTPEPAAPVASAAPEPAAAAGTPAEKPAEPATAETAPPAEPAPPAPEVVVSAVEADTAGTLFVAGTATTDNTVRVYLNDQPLGDAKPSPSGTWLVEVHHEVAPGSYQVRADQVSAADGTVVARAEVPFERTIEVATLKASGDTGAAAGADVSGTLPQVETVIIKRGDNLWNIARNNWGKGIRWSTLYQANKDQIRNPHWIYPGQVFIMPVSPDVAKN